MTEKKVFSRILVDVDPQLKREVAIKLIQENKTYKSLINELLKEYIQNGNADTAA